MIECDCMENTGKPRKILEGCGSRGPETSAAPPVDARRPAGGAIPHFSGPFRAFPRAVFFPLFSTPFPRFSEVYRVRKIFDVS